MIFPLSSVYRWTLVGCSWKTENSLSSSLEEQQLCMFVYESVGEITALTRFVHSCTIRLSVRCEACDSERGFPLCSRNIIKLYVREKIFSSSCMRGACLLSLCSCSGVSQFCIFSSLDLCSWIVGFSLCFAWTTTLAFRIWPLFYLIILLIVFLF